VNERKPEPDKLLRTADVAYVLGMARITIQNWRARGEGPPFIRISSKSVRYSEKALAKWVKDRTVSGEPYAEANNGGTPK
jgi:predicted DNA-binding transcriptional regulator AlpA